MKGLQKNSTTQTELQHKLDKLTIANLDVRS